MNSIFDSLDPALLAQFEPKRLGLGLAPPIKRWRPTAFGESKFGKNPTQKKPSWGPGAAARTTRMQEVSEND